MNKRFEKIATDVDSQAHQVRCSRAEYIEGLEYIIETLGLSLDAAKAEDDEDEDES